MEEYEIDSTELNIPNKETTVSGKQEKKESVRAKYKREVIDMDNSEEPVSCLRNERVVVRFIPRPNSKITDPKHVLYGGKAQSAKDRFVTPKLSSGVFVDVLTKKEKAFLEEILGLEYNALSIYNKGEKSFWSDANHNGISEVFLGKDDNYLDLSNPEDYIRYKILLANKDMIAPSIQELQDAPKASYKYVIISEGDETKASRERLNFTKESYKEFGKIEDNSEYLKVIVETIMNRPVANNTKLDWLQAKCDELIQADSKLFYKIVTDPLLPTKALIRRCQEKGLIAKRNDALYLNLPNNKEPLCENGETSTLNNAAKFLNAPKRQDLLFTLQAKAK